MQTDEKTVAELEIFEASQPDAPALCDLFDHTRTEGGRYALRRLFVNAPGDLPALGERQDALGFIMDNYDRWAAIETVCAAGVVDSVSSYIDTNLAGVKQAGFPALHLSALYWRLFQSESFYTIKLGTGRTRTLVTALDRFLREIGPGPYPAELERYVFRIREVLSSPVAVAAKRRAGAAGVVRLDHLVRSEHADLMRGLCQAVFELDALVSVAFASYDLDYHFPEILSLEAQHRIVANQLKNPFIKNCVPLDIAVESSIKVLLLTGPNMAGKTSFLKSLGAALYLAHLGLPVAAERFSFVPFDDLLTSMSMEEDIRSGKSYFYREIERIQDVGVIVSSKRAAIALFDELFRGTNVKDAFEASEAVIELFRRTRGSLFVVSSHLVELAEKLHGHPDVGLFKLNAEFHENGVHYPYRIEPGVSDQRLGLYLLRSENLDRLFAAFD